MPSVSFLHPAHFHESARPQALRETSGPGIRFDLPDHRDASGVQRGPGTGEDIRQTDAPRPSHVAGQLSKDLERLYALVGKTGTDDQSAVLGPQTLILQQRLPGSTGSGSDAFVAQSGNVLLAASVLALDGSTGDDVIGISDFRKVYGDDGNDVITAENGYRVAGGNGDDIITVRDVSYVSGGWGNDIINVETPGTTVSIGGKGEDRINASHDVTVSLGLTRRDISITRLNGEITVHVEGEDKTATINLAPGATLTVEYLTEDGKIMTIEIGADEASDETPTLKGDVLSDAETTAKFIADFFRATSEAPDENTERTSVSITDAKARLSETLDETGPDFMLEITV